MHLLRAVVAAALLSAAPLRAAEHDGQAWTNFMAYGAVKGELALWFDMSLRWTNDVSRLGQVLVRPAIGWKPSKNFMAYAGFVSSEVYPADAPAIGEKRPFQQMDVVLHRWEGGVLSTRSRVEQRFFENATTMQLRHRQKFLMRHEIPGTRGIEALTTYEIFLILKEADVGLPTGLEQGRVFLGVALPITDRMKLETGYQNQHVFRRDDTLMTHSLWTTLAVRF